MENREHREPVARFHINTDVWVGKDGVDPRTELGDQNPGVVETKNQVRDTRIQSDSRIYGVGNSGGGKRKTVKDRSKKVIACLEETKRNEPMKPWLGGMNQGWGGGGGEYPYRTSKNLFPPLPSQGEKRGGLTNIPERRRPLGCRGDFQVCQRKTTGTKGGKANRSCKTLL